MRTLASRRLFPAWQSSAEARQFLMAYNGDNIVAATTYGIGLAESWDGVSWTKITTSTPALAGSGSGWDADLVKDPSLMKYAPNDYRMWFSGSSDASTFQIGYATSLNGLVWTKYASNPVLTKGSSGAWDQNTVRFPLVLHEPSDPSYPFKMWYGGAPTGDTEAQGIGYAYSTDGITWTKYASNPVLQVGGSGATDEYAVYPMGILNDGGNYYLFYVGRPTNGGSGISGDGVCLATFTNPQSIYTKSGSNPLLAPSTAEQALTSDLSVGSVTVKVASTSAFHAGEPCLLWDSGSTRADCYISTIDSGTQMTLKAAASETYAWTVANSASIRSFYYGSVDPRCIMPQASGGYVLYLSPFQQFGSATLNERSGAAISTSLGSGWAYDYTRGFVLPLGNAWDTVSCENPSVIAE